MEKTIQRVHHLLETLPYIQKFANKTFVIKYGGSAMIDENLKKSFAEDIVLLKTIGIHPIIVHGGGPEINKMLETLQIPTEFIHGHRKTTQEIMDVVEMILSGKINKEIVSLLNSYNGNAIGLSGKDANLSLSKKSNLQIKLENFETEEIDLGLVGEVENFQPEILYTLQKEGFIPVISPVSTTINFETLNINADTFAGELAAVLKAEKLIMLTDTKGILSKNELIPVLKIGKIKEMIHSGTISGGMIPKVEACSRAIEKGVNKVHIIDGRISHSVLLEVFTDQGIGTLIER